MPINFFEQNCKTTSKKGKFGLCNDPPPATNPAYIEETDPDKWIAIVINPNLQQVEFYAIDNCVQLLKNDGKTESRCDGLLHYKNNLIFIELKSRKKKGSDWLKIGSNQLIKTIRLFKKHCDIQPFTEIKSYVCNNLKPLANQGHAAIIQKFKDETGTILKAQQTIEI